MKAEIITIGDEILIGQIIDTNSSWLGQELSKIGIAVVHRTSVSDNAEAITNALNAAASRADIVITTGGLGPTKDDITKHTFASFFNVKLIQHKEVLDWVTRIFASRNLPVIEANLLQAMVPENCEVLFNKNGTAPGMWMKQNGKVFISLPGVPFEMKGIMQDFGFQKLKDEYKLPFILHRTIQTCAIGESFLAKRIENWENSLPSHIKLAYLPSVGMVRLRLSASSENPESLKQEMQQHISALYDLVGKYIYGEEDDSLPSVIGSILKSKNKTVATAESCTGGFIAHQITSIPGSSSYYLGSIVSYSNDVKIKELGIDPSILETDGAVSEACVRAMSESVRVKMNSDFAIATSGIAGPDGGSAEKPVGTVWIAVTDGRQTIAEKFNFGDHRERTIQRSAIQALFMLRNLLIG